MDESAVFLQSLRDELAGASSDDVGQMSLAGETLSLLDGRLNLEVVVHRDRDAHPALAHCHVISHVSDRNEPLDACVVGINPNRGEALQDAASSWVQCVAGPILSLVHGRPVLDADHFDGSQAWGVPGCHGFAGPLKAALTDDAYDFGKLQGAPLFEFAQAMAPPGVVHLAKVTLNADGSGCWDRSLEVDGHAAVHAASPWRPELSAPSQGVLSQFCVFHFADQQDEIAARREVDDAIRRFVAAFQQTDDPNVAADALEQQGVAAELVHRVANFTPSALCRVVFDNIGVTFSPTYTRIHADGTVEEDLPLMNEPVFARSMALGAEFMFSELAEPVKKVALASAELNVINKALHAGSQLEDLQMTNLIIPDAGISETAFQRGIAQIHDPQRGAARD